jgi:hypothetical protein
LSSETPTLLENGRHGERALHLSCFSFKVGCCRLFGDLYFNLACMYVIYNDICKCVLVMDDYIRGAYTLRIGSGPLHDGWHSTWSQKGLLLSQ